MKTIIEMAEDVGAYIADLPLEDAVLFEVDILSGRSAKLEAFAALVRADEREACAEVADEYANGLERNYSEIIADTIRARVDA